MSLPIFLLHVLAEMSSTRKHALPNVGTGGWSSFCTGLIWCFVFSTLSMFLTFDVSTPGIASGGIRPGGAVCSGQIEGVSIALLIQLSFGLIDSVASFRPGLVVRQEVLTRRECRDVLHACNVH